MYIIPISKSNRSYVDTLRVLMASEFVFLKVSLEGLFLRMNVIYIFLLLTRATSSSYPKCLPFLFFPVQSIPRQDSSSCALNGFVIHFQMLCN